MFVDSLEPCTAVYPENYPEPFRDDVKTLDVPKPELVMYPNPAGNTLNVLFETAQSATIQIIDPIGKVVLEKSTKTHSQPWEIDISSLPAGMYVVKCIMEDRQKVITLPLVKMSN
jgi:DNA-binding beta-propeller fold protein YncE